MRLTFYFFFFASFQLHSMKITIDINESIDPMIVKIVVQVTKRINSK